MNYQQMRSAVMSKLALDGVKKRHKGMTDAEISAYYSKLRMGKTVRKTARRRAKTPVHNSP
jgi:hypothetical protein